MNPPSRPPKRRVAVLGASGIGRHHANWWTVEGTEVCAILGTSEASLAATAARLESMFGFAGKQYTDLDSLLATEKPEIVDVCTPPELHYQHARKAIEAGCDVLCEKPFVYNASLPNEQLLGQAEELLALASDRGCLFGICTQYVVASEICLELIGSPHRPGAPRTFRGELVSPTRGRAPNPVRTWVDLSPHMLGALNVFAPSARIRWESLETEFAEHRAFARFALDTPAGETIQAEILTDHTDGDPSNIRRLSFDGVVCEIEGAKDEAGHFCADIHVGPETFRHPDSMRLLIRRFLTGQTAVSGKAGLVGLERMLRVIRHAQSVP